MSHTHSEEWWVGVIRHINILWRVHSLALVVLGPVRGMDGDSPGRGYSWSHWPSLAVLGPFLHVCISQLLPSQNL